MKNITLRRIDESNFIDAFQLELGEGQEVFVSHPVRSLAQAYVYYHQCTPFAIYAEDCMVGYVMVIYDLDTREYNLWHLMIDKNHQLPSTFINFIVSSFLLKVRVNEGLILF